METDKLALQAGGLLGGMPETLSTGTVVSGLRRTSARRSKGLAGR